MSSRKFINEIVEAHGGLDRYTNLSCIDVTFEFTGAALAMKRRPTHLTPRALISTKEQKVSLYGLGGPPDEAWIYTPSKLYKQSSSGKILDFRDSPRAAFDGHTRGTPWDDFHFLYFVGYALSQYFNFPYLLTRDDFVTTELAPHQELDEHWRVLEVTFPDPSVLVSHSRSQTYYFNDKLELVRHGYAPDIMGGKAGGVEVAHYTRDYVVVGDMKFPTTRQVFALGPDGKRLYSDPPQTSFSLIFTKIELRDYSGGLSPEHAWNAINNPKP